MKCIKLIKQAKNIEVGTITRVDNNEAESRVKGGYWKYVPKNEWKSQFKTDTVNDQITDSVTVKEKNKKSSKKVS
jgi:hypothetical protein